MVRIVFWTLVEHNKSIRLSSSCCVCFVLCLTADCLVVYAHVHTVCLFLLLQLDQPRDGSSPDSRHIEKREDPGDEVAT